ncbi:MAG: cysteine--tRNA ligase [Candidatus Nealsonbacteria bacterium]|nr:cysteine--tRNA ligase [Candidatus Nealsonbacteria bacterium]
MLKIYNTLSRKKEVFKPRKGKKVELFVCGPTVYDLSHIGHARTYIAFDLMAKYLKEKGYDVFYLQNITDIDDKIIQRAKDLPAGGQGKTTPAKLARFYEKEYLKDMKTLKVNSVTKYARATDHIKEIISQIERLKKKGYAYQINDGIYYDIKKFKDYGKLSRRTAIQAEDGVSRIDESKEKKNKGDFCLWKISKPGEPKWPSPFGQGRPGWHIEDTAIAEKFFGPQYDAHGGGRDLIFPHHEAELAQMEAMSGKSPMVKYWLHTGFLTVNGQKMAKSLGNFITIQDFVKQNSPRTLRFLMVKNHYRSPIDYSENSLTQTKKELQRIDEFISKLKSLKNKKRVKKVNLFSISAYASAFEETVEDDFNTPKAIAVIFELINKTNSLISQNLPTKKEAKNILDFLKKIDKIFDFIFWPIAKIKPPQNVLRLAEHRQKYRKKKEWQKADETREEIQKQGWLVEDTKEGPKLKHL